MTAAVPHAVALFTILGVVVVIAMVLGYRISRDEPKPWRTRLGVFVERDRYPEDAQHDPELDARDDADTQEWPRTPS